MVRFAKIVCIVLLGCGVFASQGEAAHKVLFDAGHGERFLIGENGPLHLSGFAGILTEAGLHVANLEKPISDASLAGADGLVISAAFVPLQPEEIEAIVRFIKRGGRLSVMLHSAPPLSSLLDRLGVMHTIGFIEERENVINGNPHDFRVKRHTVHPLLRGISEFSLHGVWGVSAANYGNMVIASTSPKAWVDLRDGMTQTKEVSASFGVACAGYLGKGGFLVFGADSIFQNKFLDTNNKALAANLAGWLAGNTDRTHSPLIASRWEYLTFLHSHISEPYENPNYTQDEPQLYRRLKE